MFDWILKALGPAALPYLVYNEDVVDPWGRLPFSCVNHKRSLLSHWQLNICIIYKPEMRHSGITVGGEEVVVYIRHKRLPQTTN